jgi:hypothetical protein
LVAVNLSHNKQMLSHHDSTAFNNLVEKFNDFSRVETELQTEEMKTFKNNRQFITDCFFEVLSEGLGKVKELTPSDPFEYLVT